MQSFQTIKLSELTAKVQNALSAAFANKHFWVIAEVTNYSFYSQKNHHYFDLVEKAQSSSEIVAKMPAVAWATGDISIRNFERSTGQKFKNDIQVLVNVSIDFHPSYGLKLTLHDVDVNFTIGALEKQKQETLERLLDECSDFISKIGDRFITLNNRLPLPEVIQNIAVISSSQSAGLHDFTHTIESNSFGYRFNLVNYYTVVQGEAKAELVYNKMLEVFLSGIAYDVVVIIRGGGGQTDFLIFDQFILGKIVAKFPIPVITGIGHQKNETIVDLMAHTSTKTPTKAAEFIIAHNRAFEEKIASYQNSIIIKSQQIINRHKDLLVHSRQVVVNKTKDILYRNKNGLINAGLQLSAKPKIIVAGKVNELANIVSHLKTFHLQFLKNQANNLNHFTSIIKTMSPANILKKGFAIVKVNGVITGDPEIINTGSEMSVILSNKEIKTTVKSKIEYHGEDFDV